MNAPEKIPDSNVPRWATFVAAARHVPAWTVAQALNTLTPGLDHRGCTKKDMAEFYSCSNDFGAPEITGQALRDAIEKQDRERLEKAAGRHS